MSGVSPWRLALGPRLAELDPALASYFSDIPAGSAGHGVGVFDTVGTPRRWLWPILAVLARAGIAFPVWERDVPFEVRNEPCDDGVRATLEFRFSRGRRVMRHEIRMTPHGLVDLLGSPARLEARLDARPVGGRLELASISTVLRVGRLRLPIPFAPRVHLVERRDADRQRVELALVAPLIGRIYEYAGSFDYRIEAA